MGNKQESNTGIPSQSEVTIGAKARKRILRHMADVGNTSGDILSFLAERYAVDPNITSLSKEIGLHRVSLTRVFDANNLDRLTPQESNRRTLNGLREDPEFIEKQATATSESSRNMWERPDYRERMSAAAREQMLDFWSNEQNHTERADAMRKGTRRKLDEDEDFRNQKAAVSRKTLAELKKDPNFIKAHAEATRENAIASWAEGRMQVFSITGKRGDLEFPTASMYESNIARILILEGRSFSMREVFPLTVPPEYRIRFGLPEETIMMLDFLVLDQEQQTGYEIMASHFEAPVGWIKVNLFRSQYPNIDLQLITEKAYRQLQRMYKNAINSDPRFRGWETTHDNLKTNGQIFIEIFAN